jgi:alkylation response protein AidB-like acyl-CoA dehydrogenase
MTWERACILATCLGTMRRQLERCINHARRRR